MGIDYARCPAAAYASIACKIAFEKNELWFRDNYAALIDNEMRFHWIATSILRSINS
jgi:hypothetical protein